MNSLRSKTPLVQRKASRSFTSSSKDQTATRTALYRVDSKEIRILKDIFRIERSELFDPSFYLENNPDLRDLKSPIRHFVTSGCYERRNPNILFDIEFYLRTNPEIDPSKQNPLVHFIDRGWKDNRNPHALFDIQYFLRHRKDSKALLRGNPLAEFLNQAPSSGVAHHPLFDCRYYVEQVQEGLNGQPR